MSHVPMSAASVISDDVNAVIRAQDDALLANQLLFVSILKTARNAAVPFKDEQRMFASLHVNATKMLETRWAIGDSLKLVRTLATQCGAAAVMEGCAGACPVNTLSEDNTVSGMADPTVAPTPAGLSVAI